MKPPILTTTRRQAMATAGLGLFGASLSSTARDHVVLEPDVACAVISDNTSRARLAIINNAKGKTVIRDNIGEA